MTELKVVENEVKVNGLAAAVEFVKGRIEDAHKARTDGEAAANETYKRADQACRELTGYGIGEKITAYDVVCIMQKILKNERITNE